MKHFLATLAISLLVLFIGLLPFSVAAEDYPVVGNGVDTAAANTWTADQTYSDNVKTCWGTGKNSCFKFDGTDFILTVQDVGVGNLRIDAPIEWTAGVAVTAAEYWIGRNADGTNALQLNAPLAAKIELSINDVMELEVTAGQVDINAALEVGGNSEFDTASFVGDITLDDDIGIFAGFDKDFRLEYNTTQTVDTGVLTVSAASNILLIVQEADIGFDFAHGQETHPTIIAHSNAQSTTQFVFLRHFGTAGLLASNVGQLQLRGATGVLLQDAGNNTALFTEAGGDSAWTGQGLTTIDSPTGIRVGTAGMTGHGLGVNDLLVSADLEVKGIAFVDGTLRMLDSANVLLGSSNDAALGWRTHGGEDTLVLALGDTANSFIITSTASLTDNHGVAAQADPTLYVFSDTDVGGGTTDEWISFTHDKTDGVISIGSGVLQLPPTAMSGAFTASGGGALTGTWTDMGDVATINIDGGTIDGVTIGASSAAAITATTITASGNITTTGDMLSSDTGNLGWTVQSADNQACSTTCTTAAVFGLDNMGGGALVGPEDATADTCVCAGAN